MICPVRTATYVYEYITRGKDWEDMNEYKGDRNNGKKNDRERGSDRKLKKDCVEIALHGVGGEVSNKRSEGGLCWKRILRARATAIVSEGIGQTVRRQIIC